MLKKNVVGVIYRREHLAFCFSYTYILCHLCRSYIQVLCVCVQNIKDC